MGSALHHWGSELTYSAHGCAYWNYPIQLQTPIEQVAIKPRQALPQAQSEQHLTNGNKQEVQQETCPSTHRKKTCFLRIKSLC